MSAASGRLHAVKTQAPGHVVHTIFDDSTQWSVVSTGVNVSEGEDAVGGFCRTSLHMEFGHSGGHVHLQPRSGLLGLDEPGFRPSITFLARALGKPFRSFLLNDTSHCNSLPSSSCGYGLCIGLSAAPTARPAPTTADTSPVSRRKKHTSTTLAPTAGSVASRAISLCAASRQSAGAWTRVTLPLEMFSRAISLGGGVVAIYFVSTILAHGVLLVDDLQIISERIPTQVVTPFVTVPTPDHLLNAPELSALAADDTGNAAGEPGYCQYLSSEYRRSRRSSRELPRCRMDGDHLRGRWIQNCEPSQVGRPDVYAYGRPLPALNGKFDFRACFRTSLWERMRVQRSLSWTWRPFDCKLEVFDAEAFDRWLGPRTLLLLGDSLTAQMYYSLVFFLGASVTRQLEHRDGVRGADTAGDSNTTDQMSVPVCSSSAADEGLSAFSEVQLSHGGRVVKVLGHNRYIQELQRAASAPWARFARDADFVVLNVSLTHSRQLDPPCST